MINVEKIEEIFQINENQFFSKAFCFYQYQAQHNPLFSQYISALNFKNETINSISDFAFLPISFFKSHLIETSGIPLLANGSSPITFESSGTTLQNKSKHFVPDSILYNYSFINSFQYFYGAIEEYCVIGLLPSYLEQGHSSLVYMMNHLIEKSRHPDSRFYLYNHQELFETLISLESQKQKTIVVGVTYALLDFAEKYPHSFSSIIFMETGGMKGRRQEMIREDVHHILKSQWNLDTIHSEYGMTELMSQAYSKCDGIFHCPPWMKVIVRDIYDPFQIEKTGKGVLNIIDLANIHSCCFIATDDLGEVYTDGSFKVIGRLDNSDIRGCNLMYQDSV